MTLKITGSVENVQDVETLSTLVSRGGEGDPLYWAGYPVLIALETYWTGLIKGGVDQSEREKTLIEEVNTILETGICLPLKEKEV